MEHDNDIKRLLRRSRQPARLVFDTADHPLPAGVRRRDVTSRHLLYQAGDLCLDLRVEREPRSARTALVGQLADVEEPLKPLPGVPVLLLSEEKILARTTSNRMGEFQLECDGAPAMSLCLPVGENGLIELPVDRRTTKRPAEPPVP